MCHFPFVAIVAANGLYAQKSGAKWSADFRLDHPTQHVRFGSTPVIEKSEPNVGYGPEAEIQPEASPRRSVTRARASLS
jgi:hypothetical protein